MQPAGTTTTTEIWQWQCAVCRGDWKMMRQVTTTCPHGHGCSCSQGTPPSAGNPPLSPTPHHNHHHHHRHRHHLHQEEGSRALAAADEGSNYGRNIDITTLSPAPPAVAQVCWVPDPYLMVQQLREFESLNHEVVALRVQLQEYAWEIDRSIKSDNDARTNWFLDLPANVRDVLVMARDAIESFIAFSTTAPAN